MLAIGPLLAVIATVVLIFAAAAIAFGGVVPAIVASASLLLAPLVWSLWSTAPMGLLPLAFLTAWLFAIAKLGQSDQWWWAVAAGVSLGAGAYLSPPALVMMPCFAALTIVIALASRSLSPRVLAIFAGAFALGITPLLMWWVTHAADFRALINAHHLYDANRFNVLQGAREVTSWVGLTARSEVFWDYLNPAFLFVTGSVLAWPLIVLLPLGIYRVMVAETTLVSRLSLAGYVVAPLAASLTAEPPIRMRIVWIIPFAAMLSAAAIRYLMDLRRRMAVAGVPAASATIVSTDQPSR